MAKLIPIERLQRRTRPVTAAEIEWQLLVLRRFTEVYCRHHHHAADGELCPECRQLVDYARDKLKHCPFDPKPKCKQCPVHCYQPAMRQRVREIMRYAGMYFVKRGRLDWLLRYFLT